jgi:hypothetical protein
MQRNLHFQEQVIISKTEQKARRVKFSPGRNLILGENDVGKSTLIKSLYYTLGADVPQLSNSRWKLANAIYILKFSIDGISRYVVRDERYFGFFDESKRLISQYRGIGWPDGFSAGINPLLNFNIELEGSDDRMHRVAPSYYFLPFYVDQDHGWSTHWSSFNGLQAIKDYRKNLLDYHLGLRAQSYYDDKSKVHLLTEELSKLSANKSALIEVRDEYKKRKIEQQVDVDPLGFKSEIEELVATYNDFLRHQELVLTEIKAARNARLHLQQELAVLERAIRELESDYSYLENPETDDVIDCPTCGTEFNNSIASRFGVLDDIDYCKSLVDQRQKAIWSRNDEIERLDLQYNDASRKLSSLNDLLARKRAEVTFADLVRAEGYKDILNIVSGDIQATDDKQARIEGDIKVLKTALRPDTELKKSIVSFYQAKMKEALNKLNVKVLSEEDYKSPDRAIRANALGSDLPRALLAQHISLLHTMRQYNEFTVCPLVIDSPLQQEQDDSNAVAIFKFILEGALSGQQLILGTLPSAKVDSVFRRDDCIILELTEKYGLLQSSEYETIISEFGGMHSATLASPN